MEIFLNPIRIEKNIMHCKSWRLHLVLFGQIILILMNYLAIVFHQNALKKSLKSTFRKFKTN